MELGIRTRIEQQFGNESIKDLVIQISDQVGNNWRNGLKYPQIPDTLEEKWAHFAVKKRFQYLLREVDQFIREYVDKNQNVLNGISGHVDGLVKDIQNRMQRLLASFKEGYIMGRLRSSGMTDIEIRTSLKSGWVMNVNGRTRVYRGDPNELYYQLHTDPYLVLGMTPEKLHEIAERLGRSNTVGYKLRRIVHEVVQLCQSGKHVCYPVELLEQILPEFPYSSYSNFFDLVLKEKYGCVIRDGFFYLPYQAEVEDMLYEIFSRKDRPTFVVRVNEDIDNLAGDDQDQNEAIRCILTNPTSIITGGPGTGKTRTVKQVIPMIYGIPYYVLTPTGKAALNYTTDDMKAMTCHRFLICLEHPDKIRQKNKIDITKPGYVFFDESSMLENSIVAHICRRLKNWRFVFVGDPHQLPPVQCGNFFVRAIEAGITPMVKLTTTHRQKNGSTVLDTLEKIRQKRTDFESDMYCDYHLYTEEDKLRTVLSQHKAEKRNVKIICPKNADVKKMNNVAREILLDNPTRMSNGWYVGSLVIVTQNFYGLEDGFELMNGEEGEIIGGGDGYVDVNFGKKGTIRIKVDSKKSEDQEDETDLLGRSLDDDFPISFKNRDELTTAYLKESFAITVHASQGSEWYRVIFYSSDRPNFFFNQKLGYTAFSRAREFLHCYGTYNFRNFVFNNPIPRYDNLGFRLRRAVPTIPPDHPQLQKCKVCGYHFEHPWSKNACDRCKKKPIPSFQKECLGCRKIFQGKYNHCSKECFDSTKTGRCIKCQRPIELRYRTCYSCR